MVQPWSDVARAIWDPDPDVTELRATYAIQRAVRLVMDAVAAQTREHIAMYATWQCGQVNPDSLADSLCDHLRDVIPLPADAVGELLP